MPVAAFAATIEKHIQEKALAPPVLETASV
jgi:hypothetical protein